MKISPREKHETDKQTASRTSAKFTAHFFIWTYQLSWNNSPPLPYFYISDKKKKKEEKSYSAKLSKNERKLMINLFTR